jgi:hypothetical protein
MERKTPIKKKPAPKKGATKSMITEKQLEDAIKAALASQPQAVKESALLRWAPVLLAVVGWFASIFVQAGITGQRLNALEVSVHDVTTTSMPSLTVQAKFDEVNGYLKLQDQRMERMERKIDAISEKK